jgi:ubiquinone/menaquinone biosynthesis C-methylase UbiE
MECLSCRRSFPIIFGIPDLRIFPDPYIEFEEDRLKAEHLAAEFDRLNFEEMVRFYYLTTAVVPQHHARQYTRGLFAAEARSEAQLIERLRESGSVSGPFLEIGCGTAPFLIAAKRQFGQVVGVDIALRWLIVAKKRLEQAGVKAPLICACAEALPFPEPYFRTALFDSTIEVVTNQQKSLSEVKRVLLPGGDLWITTPNRFSLGPDPHLGIWAGGFLPDRWMAAYARKQGAIPPKRNLLNAQSLKRLLKEAAFERVQVSVPSIPEAHRNQLSGAARQLISLYNISRRIGIVRWILQLIGPLLQATARKPS